MDDDELQRPLEWSRKCLCGKLFYHVNSYSNHINSCKRYKRSVGATLEEARARYQSRALKKGKGKRSLGWRHQDADLDVDHVGSVAPGPSQPLAEQAAGRLGSPDVGNDIIENDPKDPAHKGDQAREDSRQPEPDSQLEARAQPMPIDPPRSPEPLHYGRGHRAHRPVQRFKDFTATSTIPFNIPSALPEDNGDSIPGLPQPSTGVVLGEEPEVPPDEVLRRTIFDDRAWKTTPPNSFGLYKKFWTLESRPHDPDSYITAEDLREDEEEADGPGQEERMGPSKENPFFPFPNWSSFRLGEWYWADSQEKGQESFRALLGILTSDDFDPSDIRAANWDRINTSLAASEFEEGIHGFEWLDDGTSWLTTTVGLEVPFNRGSLQPGVHLYEVQNFRHRPLVPIIRERLRDVSRGDHFHIVPSELRWAPQTETSDHSGPDVRIYGELYNSPAFIDAYKEVQALPVEVNEGSLPRYVVALMFASDETMLASFGSSKLWPLYMMFGNESKHRRGKSSLKLFEEVAYFQTIPDEFKDWYLKLSGKRNVGNPLSTHLNRELFHAQWRTLLDDEFLEAYSHGIIVDCFDNVRRRFYPRILTYSADYPERVTVVGIRNMGDHPCPRCLVPITDIHGLGTPEDIELRVIKRRVDDPDRKRNIESARSIIYKRNYNVNTDEVERLLKPTSLVPTVNAFSQRLSAHGLDIYDLIAVDILHEVEIGVWKSLFIQLLRLLEAIDKPLLNVLDGRFRQIPTFGKDTIRRFRNNVSEMKQLAARDYEDILQCAMVAFDGLLPDEHDSRAQDLLFVFANWHSLAKLKLHTDDTLSMLDEWTVALGAQSRLFVANTCGAYETRELKREYQSRKRGEARKKGKAAHSRAVTSVASETIQKKGSTRKSAAANKAPKASADALDLGDAIGEEPDSLEADSRRLKTWSLNTSKFHALGDVASYIRRFGTTDSYSTQLSERFHRFPKARYRRTNKKQTPYQLSRIQTRQARIKKLRKQLSPAPEEGVPETGRDKASYFIGKSQHNPVSMSHFLRVNESDPALRMFYPKLRRHILPRIIEKLLKEASDSPDDYRISLPVLQDLHANGGFTAAHSNAIYLHSDRFYRHSVLQINYTTYDCRTGQDTLNPSTSRRNIMCLRREPSDLDPLSDGVGGRFVYARILAVVHMNIVYGGPGMLDHRPRRFDLLWVRWYEPLDPEFSESTLWQSKRMERVRLRPLSDPEACDFIDPSDIVRAAHIIPRFSKNKLFEGSGSTPPDRIFSQFAKDAEDWNEYYVNPFVDRDMTMRFHWGMAVGHAYTHVDAHRHGHPLGAGPVVQAQTSGIGPTQMDVDNSPAGESKAGGPSPGSNCVAHSVRTDTEDSNYDRPQGSDDGVGGDMLSDDDQDPGIPEPDSSDGDYENIFE